MHESEMEIVLTASPRSLRELPRVLGDLSASVRTRPRRFVQDHYLDTASQLLMRSGIACRLRQIGKRSSLTLKSLTAFHDGLADRVEITEELPDGNWAGPAPLPGSKLRAFLFPVTRHPIVKCLFTLDQKRRVYEVRTPDGTCLEVSADHVIFPGGSGKRLYRIEIELREGTTGSLSRFGASVRRSLGLTSADESKFDCGLRAAGIAIPRLREGPALTLRPGDPVQKAAARAFTRQYRRMLWHEPGTRLGINPESLHDMRVSVRRLRAVLRLFRPALPPATTAHLAAELKWLGRSLGAVRDLDVHLQECPVVLRSLSSPCRTAPEMCRLAMGQRRDQAYAALRLALRGRRFRSLKQSCRDFIRLMGTAAPGATNTAVADAALLKRGDLQTILRSGRDIDTDTPHETVHRLRVRCKRLRYACETLSSLYRKPVSKMARRLAALQDSLGAYQDAVTAQTLIADGMRGNDGRTADAAEVRTALQECSVRWLDEQRSRRAAILKAWKAFDRRKAQRSFAKAIRRPKRTR